MRLMVLIILLSSCKPTDIKLSEIESIIEEVSSKSSKCSNCINPEIRVHNSGIIHKIAVEKIIYLQNNYRSNCMGNEHAIISFSVYLNSEDAKVILTCDFPRIDMQTSESSITWYNLTKSGNSWLIVSEELIN